ncbi:hypothetical protein QYZ88_006345 [Lachnospiraceae bacterium C1.1]|nr:hypothetical protein [Lachnospiraceae bacterium C1.1]
MMVEWRIIVEWLLIAVLFTLILLLAIKNKETNDLKKELKEKDGNVEKLLVNNEILKDWIILRLNNISLCDWLISNDISKVAIYGYGILGQTLMKELEGSRVEVICIVDKNYKNIFADVPTVSIDNIPLCDAVIISVVNYFDEIEGELLGKCQCPIISLEDIVYGVGYKFHE